MTVVLILMAIAVALWWIVSQRKANEKKRETQRTFIERYRFPVLLTHRMRARYPDLSDVQLQEVFAALRGWFLLLHQHPKTKFGMPSKVVDDAWHEFILMTREYQTFCEHAFGSYVHHEPNEPNDTRDSPAALARTFALSGGVAAGALAGAAGAASLFSIDRALSVPGGFTYSEQDLADLQRREEEARHSSGSGCGGGVSVDSSSDGGSGDGGGSSCGSSGCGGGCGGGS